MYGPFGSGLGVPGGGIATGSGEIINVARHPNDPSGPAGADGVYVFVVQGSTSAHAHLTPDEAVRVRDKLNELIGEQYGLWGSAPSEGERALFSWGFDEGGAYDAPVDEAPSTWTPGWTPEDDDIDLDETEGDTGVDIATLRRLRNEVLAELAEQVKAPFVDPQLVQIFLDETRNL